jgi:hypothetical protein
MPERLVQLHYCFYLRYYKEKKLNGKTIVCKRIDDYYFFCGVYTWVAVTLKGEAVLDRFPFLIHLP